MVASTAGSILGMGSPPPEQVLDCLWRMLHQAFVELFEKVLPYPGPQVQASRVKALASYPSSPPISSSTVPVKRLAHLGVVGPLDTHARRSLLALSSLREEVRKDKLAMFYLAHP